MPDLDSEFGKRGRKTSRSQRKFHEKDGRDEVRLRIIFGTSQSPEVFRRLELARAEALKDRSAFLAIADEIEERSLTTPYLISTYIRHAFSNPAMRHIVVWANQSSLLTTDWAVLFAVRVLVYSMGMNQSALNKVTEYPVLGSPMLFATFVLVQFLKDKQLTDMEKIVVKGVARKKRLSGAGFLPACTGDFGPELVAYWLARRLVKPVKLAQGGQAVVSWHQISWDSGEADHKTVQKHVLALARYAGVPITSLQ